MLADPGDCDPGSGENYVIFTLLACTIFGDPAVPDPRSAKNRVKIYLDMY